MICGIGELAQAPAGGMVFGPRLECAADATTAKCQYTRTQAQPRGL